MIVNKRTGFVIQKDTKYAISVFDASEWLFVVPEHIVDNHLKVVYKVGYLKKFYHMLDPNLNNAEIFQKINTEWQVFIGERQMERLWKKYTDLFEKKGES